MSLRRMTFLGLTVSVACVSLGRAMTHGDPPAQPPAPSSATKFTIFIYESPAEAARRKETGEAAKAYWGPFMEYAKRLQDAGVMRPGGCCLQLDDQARVIRSRDGKLVTSRGSHARSGDGSVLGGYFIIEAADMDEAMKWAEAAPNAATGAVEVRGSYPAPM